MTIFSSQSPRMRIGLIKGEILAHAMPVEVLSKVGAHKPQPRNSGDTVIFRRYLPLNATTSTPNQFFTYGAGDRTNAMATTFLASEGVTPTPDTLVPQDISVTLNEYTVLFGYTKRTVDIYEDDIPAEMKSQTGERVGLIKEMVMFGAIKTGTNKFYGGTGTSRDTVNGKITLLGLRKIARSLKGNHAVKVTSILSGSTDFGSTPVEAAYIVFCHTDCESDIRDLPKFRTVAEYGSQKPISEYEIGTCEEFRFIASPELVSVQGGGAAVGVTGLLSTNTSTGSTTTGTNVDVYQTIVCGKDAWGDVSLRGPKSMDIHDVKPSQPDHGDPTGQRGYFGASFYHAGVVLNNGWFAVYEHGVSAL